MRFDKQVLPINAGPGRIVREQKKPEELTMRELRQQIELMRTQFVDTKKLETELYQRITIPMASLVFAIIGVNPAYAVWLPNVAGLLCGAYLMREAAR